MARTTAQARTQFVLFTRHQEVQNKDDHISE